MNEYPLSNWEVRDLTGLLAHLADRLVTAHECKTWALEHERYTDVAEAETRIDTWQDAYQLASQYLAGTVYGPHLWNHVVWFAGHTADVPHYRSRAHNLEILRVLCEDEILAGYLTHERKVYL